MKNNNIILSVVLAVVFFVLVFLALNNFTPKNLINSLNPASYSNASNEILGFGSNFAGQLGQDNLLKSPLNIQTIGAENVIKFDAGNKHTVVVTSEGEVIQYGINGITSESNQRYIEIKEGQRLSNVVDVQAGADYSLALLADGTVWSWGQNLAGQLGHGNNAESLYALKIDSLSDITQISAGYKFGLALSKFGNVWAWGGSCSEARKKAADEWLSTPMTVPGLGGYYDPTSLGGAENLNNQSEEFNSYCANQQVIGFSTKVPIKIEGLNSITKLSAGWGHTLAIDTNGDVWGFGCNLYGQVSNTPNHMKPYKFQDLKNIVEVSAGYRHSLALNRDGKVFGWGYNLRGSLGSISDKEIQPKEIKTKNIKSIVAGHDFSVLLNNEGKLIIFGENNSGVINNNLNVISNPNPLIIYADRSFESITSGRTFVLALSNK